MCIHANKVYRSVMFHFPWITSYLDDMQKIKMLDAHNNSEHDPYYLRSLKLDLVSFFVHARKD